jgi:hypothetical protein
MENWQMGMSLPGAKVRWSLQSVIGGTATNLRVLLVDATRILHYLLIQSVFKVDSIALHL